MSQGRHMNVGAWKILNWLRGFDSSGARGASAEEIAAALWPDRWRDHPNKRGEMSQRVGRGIAILEHLGYVEDALGGVRVSDEGRSYAAASGEYWRKVPS